jgi:hypothetical protein
MSDQSRENAKWFHEKGVVMRGYVKGRNDALSVVAGRGFLRMPGFLYDAENDMETDTKLKLSEINFAILQDSIERELKQTGISYDLSYRNFLMEWELQKQEMLTDWDKELAWIKMDMAGKDEAMSRLEIETASRGTVLLEAKTAIELQAEAIRNQIAALDDDTADYVVMLANQKLLTAQKKLEIIPILQLILAKERELLAAEQQKTPLEQSLLAAKLATTAKKEELIPHIAELTTVTEQYGRELAEQAAIELKTAEQRVIDAGISIDKADVRTEAAEARKALEEKNLELLLAKIATRDAGNRVDESVMNRQLDSQMTLNATQKTTDGAINESETATNQAVLADKEAVIGISEKTKTNVISEQTELDRHRIYQTAYYDARRIAETAELDKISKVTSSLKHILAV